MDLLLYALYSKRDHHQVIELEGEMGIILCGNHIVTGKHPAWMEQDSFTCSSHNMSYFSSTSKDCTQTNMGLSSCIDAMNETAAMTLDGNNNDTFLSLDRAESNEEWQKYNSYNWQ